MIKQLDKTSRRDYRYLNMAEEWSQESYCIRKKVGALVVKDDQIISDGFNGTPSGFPNICELPGDKTSPLVLHAESNAITKLSRSTNSSIGATMYTTLSPCFNCALLIIQSKIKRVVFREVYRDTVGIDLLLRAGIEVVHLNEDGEIQDVTQYRIENPDYLV